MMKIAETMKQDLIDCFAQEFRTKNPRLAVSAWNQSARKIVDADWLSFSGRMARIGGKSMLAELNKWSQAEFGVSFSAARLASELLATEIAPEAIQFLESFEENERI